MAKSPDDREKSPKLTPFEAACSVCKALADHHHEAWIVGGAVRDVLLGVAPNALREVDVATSALPEAILSVFKRNAREMGKAFGVVQVVRGGQPIEVATFRVDGEYVDGRRPTSVRFATAKEDVERRDFTMNGLLWNPELPIQEGIVDHVGGRADLEQRVVRAIGDPLKRFEEDHLRMLRAVRFAATRDFRLEQRTEAAIASLAPRLALISAERCREELQKIVQRRESRPGDAWVLLVRTRLAEVLLPWCAKGAAEAEDDARVLQALHPAPLPVFLAVVLRRVVSAGEPLTRFTALAHAVGEKLRLSLDEVAELESLLRGRVRYRALMGMRLARQRLAATRADREWHERLLAAEGDAPSVLALLAACRQECPERPAPVLDGRALIAAGLRPGPLLGRALRRLRVLQIEGRVRDRAEGLVALKLGPQP